MRGTSYERACQRDIIYYCKINVNPKDEACMYISLGIIFNFEFTWYIRDK